MIGAIVLGVLATVVFLLLLAVVTLPLWLPFVAQAWSDARRDESWAAQIRRFGPVAGRGVSAGEPATKDGA